MTEKRLAKALAAAGVASRRTCEKMIFDGRVRVNGQVIQLPQTPVDLLRDRVEVDGKLIAREEPKVYYVLNKPPGYVCSQQRRGNEKLVLDLIPEQSVRLFTLGRLDKETSGLIIATNDGAFAQEVMHPSSGLTKEYLAKTNLEISLEHLKLLREGTLVEGVSIRPTKVHKIRKGTVKIVVKEGKKHEVRLLLKAAGLTVQSLSRIRIGGLQLGNLELGTCRRVTRDDLNQLFS